MKILALKNKHKIAVPLFGAANVSSSTLLSPTVNSKIQGIFMDLSYFPVLFKADLIFKDFTRQPCVVKYFSSLCEPCTWFQYLVFVSVHFCHLGQYLTDDR